MKVEIHPIIATALAIMAQTQTPMTALRAALGMAGVSVKSGGVMWLRGDLAEDGTVTPVSLGERGVPPFNLSCGGIFRRFGLFAYFGTGAAHEGDPDKP